MTQDEMKADFERWVVKSWPLESFNMESYCEDAYGTLQYHEDFVQGMWMMYTSMQPETEKLHLLLSDVAAAIGDLPIGDTGNAGIKRCISLMYRIQEVMK